MKKIEKIIIAVIFLWGFSLQVPAKNLLDIYQLAVQSDPILRQSYARMEAISTTRWQSVARLLPKIDVSGQSSREYLNNKRNNFQGSGRQEYWDHNATANVTQPVFRWDFWVQLSQSDNQIAQLEAEYQAEHQNLMVRTAEAYFNVLAAEDNLEFASSEKEAIARQLEQAKQRFEVGLVAVTDVYEAQAGFDSARANEIKAQNDLDNSKEALKEIIGETELAIAGLGDKLPLSGPVPQNLQEWSETALRQNLNIIAVQNQAENARKHISLQRSGHLPSLDIVGRYSIFDSNSQFGARGDSQSIGLQLNVPIFEGGAVTARTQQASFQFEEAKEKMIETQRSVNRLVKDSYRGVISSISQVEALKAAVVSSESSLEATEAGFEVGTRTMVDVLTEQRNLYSAKSDYARARYDFLINSLKLKQAASSLTIEDLQTINSLLK
ncbi:MAG: TolC family outer membrane protein [Methylococcaceae bacterium]